jgi:predicted nucleic acid-binding protein
VTPWIIDASLAMTWYLADEVDREYGLSVLDSLNEGEIRVPALFVYEFSNAMVTAHRRNRIDAESLGEVFKKLLLMDIVIDPAVQTSSSRLSTLALRYGLTCYDAAYLDLGLRTGFPIATLDKALIRAMQAAEVDLVKP